MNAAIFAHDSTTDPIGVGVLPFQKPQDLGIEWDAENRLLAVNQGTLRSEFSYDGESRRVRIVEKQNGGVTSDKRFLWCRGRICDERSPDGATINKRFFGQGMQETSTSFFYTYDHLGTVREMTDSGASTRARYEYDPYGERALVAGDKSTPFGLTGHYIHEVSGVTLAIFRAYDSRLGRWLSEDPIGLSDGPNLFSYVHGNPVIHTDRTGLAVHLCTRMADIPFANHAYIWDDRPDNRRPPGTPRTCGMQGQSNVGPLSGNETPERDNCVEVPGSQGREQHLMNCCANTANLFPWIPGVNDCFNAARDCFKALNLTAPQVPGRLNFQNPLGRRLTSQLQSTLSNATNDFFDTLDWVTRRRVVGR